LRYSLLRVLRIGHFDEGEAAGLTRVPVRDDIDLFDIAELGKVASSSSCVVWKLRLPTKILLMVSL
jgi:hypothetical protein